MHPNEGRKDFIKKIYIKLIGTLTILCVLKLNPCEIRRKLFPAIGVPFEVLRVQYAGVWW